MRFSVTYPLVQNPYDPALTTREGMISFATAAEQAGFGGIGFTDHPAPTHRWIRSGGHDALDPFAALAFVAAVTEKMLLIPNLVVLPYRNPFLVAKSVATVDALSGGRFVLAVGVGYLRGEYRALGVDFNERNSLFDEAIEVLRGVWNHDDFTYEGIRFSAQGQTVDPKPGRRVPLWIGGNSQLSRRRVARTGNGWIPFIAPRGLAGAARTASLQTPKDLEKMLGELWHLVEDAGRDRSEIDVSFSNPVGGDPGAADFNPDAHLSGLEELQAMGVTWCGVHMSGRSLNHVLEAIQRYGETVISVA